MKWTIVIVGICMAFRTVVGQHYQHQDSLFFEVPDSADLNNPHFFNRDNLAAVPGDTLHVVGHSLGGLLALHTLLRYPDPRPGRVVCLGSPLRGSVAARALAGLPFGQEILGQTMREAVLDGGLDEYRGAREVGVIAGTMGLGLGVVIENLPIPNDGTVAVEETRLPGIRDHLEIEVSHTGLLVSPLVASQTAFFLRHGQFARTGSETG